MIRRILPLVGLALAALSTTPVAGQQKITPDLTAVAEGKGGKAFNRTATAFAEGNRKGIRVEEKPGDGGVWLEKADFTNGVIELDIRGKDVVQRSFVGVAFHGVDSTAYEAVYFRPFTTGRSPAAPGGEGLI
jgi:hypothetical protein